VTWPPLHVVEAFPGLPTTSPRGNASVNDQPFLTASSLVFVIVNVSVEVPPAFSVAGLNDLSSRGVASRMRMLSKAASFPSRTRSG
jgi:hypothetical protein